MLQNSSTQEKFAEELGLTLEFWENPRRRKDEQKGQRQGRARRADSSLVFKGLRAFMDSFNKHYPTFHFYS